MIDSHLVFITLIITADLALIHENLCQLSLFNTHILYFERCKQHPSKFGS